MSESNESRKRQRKPNYSNDEVRVLLEEIMLEKAVLFSSFNTKITAKLKSEIWNRIASAVNACGVAKRTSGEVKDKWKTMKAVVLNREKKTMQTGGGPPEPPVPFADIIRDIIGEESNLYKGIKGNYSVTTSTNNHIS